MIEATLEKLGISHDAQGGSTGENWFGQGATITAISPVDGKTIGNPSLKKYYKGMI